MHPTDVAKLLVATLIILISLGVFPFEKSSEYLIFPGFDKNLIFVTNSDGNRSKIEINTDFLRISTNAEAQPKIHIFTTPLSFNVSFDIRLVQARGNVRPLEITLHDPYDNGFALWFDSVNSSVKAILFTSGTIRDALSFPYLGSSSFFSFSAEFNKNQNLQVNLVDLVDDNILFTETLTPTTAPDFFRAYRLTLTLSATNNNGSSSVKIENFRLVVPKQNTIVTRIFNVKEFYALYSVVLLAIGSIYANEARCAFKKVNKIPRNFFRAVYDLKRVGCDLRIFVTLSLASLICILLFPLGYFPFDFFSEKVWSYLLVQYGFEKIYILSQTVTSAEAFGGHPFSETIFPYPPFMSYYFYAIGWVHKFLNLNTLQVDTPIIDALIKIFNTSFLIASGFLVYVVVKKLYPSSIKPLIPVILLVYNPAIITAVAIWGETDSFLLFLLICTAFSIEINKPRLAWVLMGLTFLTKQTALIPISILAIILLKKFGIMKSAIGLSESIFACFISSLPFLFSGFAPSIIFDPMIFAVLNFTTTVGDKAFSIVSYDAYSFWPLLTFFLNGVSGINRFWYPDFLPVISGLSYLDIGKITYGALTIVLIISFIFTREKNSKKGLTFFMLAVTSIVIFFFSTRSVSRYFVFPLTFSILSIPFVSRTKYFLIFSILSFTTFLSLIGSLTMSGLINPLIAPNLSPFHNPFAAMINSLYLQDRVISLCSTMNLIIASVLYARLISELLMFNILSR